jgi:HD-GYP domain-containing protein (c-di-GMP phosphodiesterase class II)
MDHSVIDAVQQLHVQLVSLYDDLGSVENQDFFNSLCASCKRIEEICQEDTDAALGTILLKGSVNYSITHAINCAIVCEVIGKRLEWAFDKRLPLLAAALTMNLGMYALQNKLSEQSKALTLKEQKLIKSHTRKSFLLLREKGVANSTWLDTVLHHHECLDGSGYPDKLRQEKISMPCRVLALVDATPYPAK